MGNIIAKIYRFMQGRYGYDSLGRFLMLAGLVSGLLCLFLRFLPTPVPYYVISSLNTLFYIFAFYRILSRNIAKRTLENERFLALCRKLIPSYDEKEKSMHDRYYLYKKCPKCSSKLRLRRIKGKHVTKCPRCGHKFKVRVFIEYKNDGYTGRYF